MAEECILCYEPLDVPVYEQNTTDDIIVGATSSRLQCGHAYHTPCVLRALQHRTVCPLCNIVGRLNDTDEEVRDGLREYKASLKDIMGVKKEFQKRVKEFKTGLRTEMGVDEKFKAVTKSKTSVMRIFSRKAKSEGTLVAGAHNLLPTYKIERFLFGAARFFKWRLRSIFN